MNEHTCIVYPRTAIFGHMTAHMCIHECTVNPFAATLHHISCVPEGCYWLPTGQQVVRALELFQERQHRGRHVR
eukprot:1161024-Pelagomonas_calceolata.AAC.12